MSTPSTLSATSAEVSPRSASADAAPLVLPFAEIGRADLPTVGGKGANLGVLAAAGFAVPPGFCVTTAGFRAFLDGGPPELRARLFADLAAVGAEDLSAARAAGAALREALVGWPIPPEVASAVIAAWQEAGADAAYALRSSATAEDLPGASFAGQQDTYLNVRGEAALLDAVRRCWVSLFTDRAILYRVQNGFEHADVLLSVVVQRMVEPEVSGILFTADPLTGHRHIASIDAGFGLGEALVGGTITADNYRVDTRTSTVVETKLGDKRHAIRSLPEGGTVEESLDASRAAAPTLDETQAISLATLGARIAAHFGSPQDIEWAIDEAGATWVLQSRPITTLYPVPSPAPKDDALHVYFSFSHAQVMTDPMSALGRSIWRTLIPFGKTRPDALSSVLAEAGGRLYMDVTPAMRLGPARRFLPRALSVADGRSAATIREFVRRPEFLTRVDDVDPRVTPVSLVKVLGPIWGRAVRRMFQGSPETAVSEVEAVTEGRLAAFRERLAAAAPGAPRLRVARSELSTIFMGLVLRVFPVIMSGMLARALLLKLMRGRVADGTVEGLLRGLEGNVTTDMDLEVGDLADRARAHPAVRAALLAATGDAHAAIDGLSGLEGAPDFLGPWSTFLERYGARGPSEIDIARPRWGEEPASLLAMVLGRLQGDAPAPGAHRVHHERMRTEGEATADTLAAAARGGLLGSLRARVVGRLARVARGNMAVREHPKFALIRMLALVKEEALAAGDSLVAAGRIDARDDVFQLYLGELIDVLEGAGQEVRSLVEERKAAMQRYAKMAPPRVLTSDGEAPVAKMDRGDAPPDALLGSAASAGVVEGIARVVLDPATDMLAPGEILVAPFTDPGWTPLFLNSAALVMEVGGLMTHGSVVAREYGIPAVVGVDGATTRLSTGDRLRVDGDRGWVEVLTDAGKDTDAGPIERPSA